MDTHTIVVLEGDQTGQELLEESLRVLAPEVTRVREAIDAKVILRIGRRIPGIRPVGGVHSPIAVVRMAVDDAYGAKEWREEKAGVEYAYRTQRLSRSTCHAVAEFSFQHAEKAGAKVFGGPK